MNPRHKRIIDVFVSKGFQSCHANRRGQDEFTKICEKKFREWCKGEDADDVKYARSLFRDRVRARPDAWREVDGIIEVVEVVDGAGLDRRTLFKYGLMLNAFDVVGDPPFAFRVILPEPFDQEVNVSAGPVLIHWWANG